MDANHILESLNEAQQQAIKSDAKQSLILAGAGSGKTRVITHKVAWLSSILDINPMSIMTVTFTNKAAREMRGRIEGILGEQLQTMWCGTFHGLFHRMLKMHWQEAGLIKSFAILDGDDQLRVIKRVMKEMNIDLDQWPPSQVQWFINKQKEEGRRKAKISSNNSYLEEKMAEIYESYQAVCEAEGLVDFAEILLRSYELLNNNEGLRDHYQRRFEYVLVDEFQDTNEIQYLLLQQIVHGGEPKAGTSNVTLKTSRKPMLLSLSRTTAQPKIFYLLLIRSLRITPAEWLNNYGATTKKARW